jgi:hypothetical protein
MFVTTAETQTMTVVLAHRISTNILPNFWRCTNFSQGRKVWILLKNFWLYVDLTWKVHLQVRVSGLSSFKWWQSVNPQPATCYTCWNSVHSNQFFDNPKSLYPESGRKEGFNKRTKRSKHFNSKTYGFPRTWRIFSNLKLCSLGGGH